MDNPTCAKFLGDVWELKIVTDQIGGGLPLVLLSGKIAADLIRHDLQLPDLA